MPAERPLDMKALYALCVALCLSFSMVYAQKAASQPKHRIVFELTSDSPEQWESLLNNVENVRKALGNGTEVNVIAHGKGLSALLKSNEKTRQRMEKSSRAGVVFAACENTMKRKNISREDLLSFSATVDSGVAEVVRKQEAGWSYIKTGN